MYTLIKPLENWVITGGYNPNRIINGQLSPHYAVDLRAVVGTPVFASNSGKVLDATNSACGNGIIIDGIDHEYSTGYCHLSQILVNPGDYVKQGDLIAYTGNTGFSLAPHLHFTVRINGQKVNPELISYGIMGNLFPSIKGNQAKNMIYIYSTLLVGGILIFIWTRNK